MSTFIPSDLPDAEQDERLQQRAIKSSSSVSWASNRYVLYCAAFSALGGLLFGYDQGVVSVILVMPQFLNRFHQVSDSSPGGGFYKGLLTAMIELGALIGALNQGWIADWISRKRSILVAVYIFLVGSILQTAALDYAMLAAARFVGGLGIGMLSMSVPLYISEISPPDIRGSMLVLEELSIVTGIVVAFWITYATRLFESEWAWRFPFALQIIPGLLLGFGIVRLPFSPRWLASNGRDEEARQALAQLRQKPKDSAEVVWEWMEIRNEIAFQRKAGIRKHPSRQGSMLPAHLKLEFASWVALFRDGSWRRTQIGIGIMFFQQFVGINALIYYSPTLFEGLGLSTESQLIMSGILNMSQLVGVTTSLWTLDRIGRRPLLLWGSFSMLAVHLAVATVVGRFSSDWSAHPVAGWTGSALLLVYMVAFGATWGPVGWALPAEIFPSFQRAKGVALSTASNWLFNFIIGLITPPLLQAIPSGTYLFFAVFCFGAAIWTYMGVPETSGRSLEEMDQIFQDRPGNSTRDHAGRGDGTAAQSLLQDLSEDRDDGQEPSRPSDEGT